MDDPITYRVRLECGNCYSRNNFDVERGTLHNDAFLICPNCGCPPNCESYSVIADRSLVCHTKTIGENDAKAHESKAKEE